MERKISKRVLSTVSLLLCSSLGYSGSALANVSLEQAVAAALDQPEVIESFRARRLQLEARLGEKTGFALPVSQFSYEDIDTEIELRASLEQRFDFSGRRERLKQSHKYREAALNTEFEIWKSQTTVDVHQAFFRVLYTQERRSAIEGWIGRMHTSLQGSRAREARGDISVYQRRRLEREILLARTRLTHEALSVEQAWQQLMKLTRWATRPTLVGRLAPMNTADLGDVENLTIRQLEFLQEAVESERDAWGSPMLRDWSFGAGYRMKHDAAHTEHGILLTLSLPIALWDRDAPWVASRQAESKILGSEISYLSRLKEQTLKACQDQLEQAIGSLVSHSKDVEMEGLTRLADLAFSAGEASLVDLLDAFQSEMELRLALLELQWGVRRAHIECMRQVVSK